MFARYNTTEILNNLLVGLTVSFVALSLGAAFGVLSGREHGALVGMLSAGVIALITSLVGGTRLQCSGPTGPMTAVTITVVQAAGAGAISVWAYGSVPIEQSAHFVNIVLILAAILIALAGVARLGRFIAIIPSSVVSGFMNGIAVIIVLSQITRIFGIDQERLSGALSQNIILTLITLVTIFALPAYLHRNMPRFAHFIPSTLIAIVVITGTSRALDLDVALTPMPIGTLDIADIVSMVQVAVPTNWSLPLILAAFPFAFQIALLCYLDTLMTSRVIDRLTGVPTRRNRELLGQALGNGAVAFFGGVPGAQATIRSVLLVKEGATMRFAGVMTGVLTILQVFAFAHYVGLIPQAVFAGVLLKVAYDVVDWDSIKVWLYQRTNARVERLPFIGFTPPPNVTPVNNLQMAFIIGTMVTTVVWNLNVAVLGFTALYHIVRRLGARL